MKTKLIAVILCVFFVDFLNAQNFPPINSGDLISQAIKLHDEAKYKDAIKLYKKIPRNDTNYVRALYELSYSLVADSNYSEALSTINLGLSKENTDYDLDFLVLRASVIDDQKNSKKALELYDSALLKYPNSQSLMLNKAVCLIRLERKVEAENLLQKLVIISPYYASAHFRLGQLSLQKGQVVPAMMCFFTYLLMAPEGSYSNSSIKLLDGISKMTDDATEFVSKRQSEAEGNFAVVEQIISSKIALDKNYKTLIGLDDPIFRQLQVMMEKLQYESDNADFYMQYYVPYLKAIFDKNYFEPAVYTAFSGVNLPKIQDYLKKNKKETDKASDVINEQLKLIRTTRELNYEKRLTAKALYHFDNGVLYGKGELSGDKAIGHWEFYHKNGNISSVGDYNSEGKKDSKWTFYFQNGKLNGIENWKNGVQEGEDITYNKQGVIITRANFLNGKLNGERINYFAPGHPFKVTTFSDGVEKGNYKQCYASGRLKIDATEDNDQLDGPYKSFFENGKPQLVCSYAKGKLNGAYKSYYDNGQLEFTANYTNGEANGEVLTYHRNGKLKRKATYVNDVIEGDELEYNDEGTLTQKVNYKKGKAEGIAEYYGDDGKLFSTFQFDNNKLKLAKYFDKQGNLISSSARDNKQIALSNYNADGVRTAYTVYNDKAEKQGTDSSFYNSGKLREVSLYENGVLSGTTTGYYSSGSKEYETNYSDDQKNGLTTNYYTNGKIQSQGWYIDGDLNGDWVNYNEKGRVTFNATYLNNDYYGTSQSFFANGVLDDETDYTSGWVTAVHQFDTTGKEINVIKLTNGTGKYHGVFFNGKTRFEGAYLQGELNGTFTNYFIDGSVETVRNYDHGVLNGDYKDYFYGGLIASEGKYEMGKKTGVWKRYYKTGKIVSEEVYEDGELNGKSLYYFENGKVEKEVYYKDGLRNGSNKRFSPDGQLNTIIYFKDDEPVSYTYNDKNSQLLAPIALKGGSGKIVSYYSNGNKAAEMEYADSKLIGAFKIYFPNGKLYYEEENLVNGLTNGKLSEYYPDGSVKTSHTYYLDNADGPYKEYYENGKIKEEGTYYNGYNNGPRKLYDINGKITTLNYYYGIILNISK